ncbi:ABC transporter permease [Marinomonas spartinae]|uniref:ABC transporter permease n=1 Tax=Marinomonas spartinae TaxID=1792290 RepID=UPI0018F12E8F|nr:ABC transporter permease subunit [Marinomonas spartinae]MBJ7554884.1 ABC transporter permease subunit [Marinomonas spartinae]
MIDVLHLLGFGDGGWGKSLLAATLVTLLLSFSSFSVGILFGGVIATFRVGKYRILNLFGRSYCTLFRGIPDLLTIYLLYYGGSMLLTSTGKLLGWDGFIGLPTFATGMLALAIISGAYLAEIFRGAYLALDKGQLEAAQALGLPKWPTLRFVIMPQIMRLALPGVSNVWQLILKDSALISVIGLVELMRQAQIGAGSTREPFIFYTAAACLYLVITVLTGFFFKYVENRTSSY